MASAPEPAPRRTSAPPSLLVNVIRSLTSSTLSDDQRELEKTRLEKGYKESEALIDNLVRKHQKDVEDSLDCFRDVSLRISTCRERIHNVRNALQTCKSLLECRRDDLRNLWMENAQQRHICEIMAELEELKDAPLRIDIQLSSGNYQEAAAITSSAKEAVEGRLAPIEGLSHLRLSLNQLCHKLVEHILDQIVQVLVVEPFEQHMRDLVRNMPEQKVQESEQCKDLTDKAPSSTEPCSVRLLSLLAALQRLQTDPDVERILSLSSAQIEKQIAASGSLIRIRANIDGLQEGDQLNLTHLMSLIVHQLESAKEAHEVFAQTVEEIVPSKKVLVAFWEGAQSAVETLVSDHLDITPLVKEPIEAKTQLFRFDATAFAGTTSSVSRTQHSLVVCPPSAYNMISMFPLLRKLMESIEKSTGESSCRLRRYIHLLVTDMFVERVKASISEKFDAALTTSDSEGKAARLQSTRVLPSCERVLDLCKEMHSLMVNMDIYAERFASLLLLVLSEYYRSVTDMYEKTTMSVEGVDGVVSKQKISASWVSDEDISRLLMSLPNWQMTSVSSNTPSTPAVESEQEVRQRNEKESEILIGNLANQDYIDRAYIVTDMGDARALASLHESLRWFAIEVRALINSLPDQVKQHLSGVMVQVRLRDGQLRENEMVLRAMDETIRRLEAISDHCLLMLHLELRVHCFYHLLPLARSKQTNIHDEIDCEVLDLGKDLNQFHQLLSEIVSSSKLLYIFDGLGHLCAAIFIHISQRMGRLSDSAKKRLSRDVWGVQQRLSQITSRREAALDRARLFFELLLHDPNRLLTVLPEHRNHFNATEMSYLVTLSVKSDPVLASQPGALEALLSQLSTLLNQPRH